MTVTLVREDNRATMSILSGGERALGDRASWSARVGLRRAAKGLVSLLAAGLPLLLAAHCGSEPPPPAEPCTAGDPKCEDPDTLLVCGDDGFARHVNCTAIDGKKCRKTAKGVGTCAKACPPGLDKYGACKTTKAQTCDGKALVESDCAELKEKCGYRIDGYALCTKTCPPGVNSNGACLGSTLHRCDGQVYTDLDCAKIDRTCQVKANGIAECSKACPPGLDAFGKCDGNVAKRCDGTSYVEEDCTKLGAGFTCQPLDRFGVGCHGCGTATPAGVCSQTGQITDCTESGKVEHESCIARGGTCGFSEDECRSTCLDPKPSLPCALEGLAPGAQKCKVNPFTHYSSIVTCNGAGKLVETECPAATDGSVTCVEAGGKATCNAACGPNARRCTNKGVLVTCEGAAVSGWTDCVSLGAKCVDDGVDAYCACNAIPPSAGRCSTKHSPLPLPIPDGGLDGGEEDAGADAGDSDAGDAGAAPVALQYSCVGGRIMTEPCTCGKP